MDIPPQLSARLATAEQSQLVKLLDEVAQFMPGVYQAAVLDHQESRGDDSALFGLRVYKHLRHEAIGVAIADLGIGVVEPNALMSCSSARCTSASTSRPRTLGARRRTRLLPG